MSTLRLTADVPGIGKKGEQIGRPFGTARDLIARGVAVLDQGEPPAPAQPPRSTAVDRNAAEVQRLTAALAAVRAESDAALKQLQADHAAELAKLRADLDAAKAAAAEAQPKPKK